MVSVQLMPETIYSQISIQYLFGIVAPAPSEFITNHKSHGLDLKTMSLFLFEEVPWIKKIGA